MISPTLPADALEQYRRLLWGLCYRMTGNAVDADDLVQETFARALAHPPSGELRSWLTAISINLARDLLRRRRRAPYDGPWLPSPIETTEGQAPSPASRYGLMETVTYAFLLALEALTPQQRAVLLLRDVFDYSVGEAGSALGISVGAVKTTHHRARRAMKQYDRARSIPSAERSATMRTALERFLACIARRDVAGAEALLTEHARADSDAAGEFHAARNVLVGPRAVVRLFMGLTQKRRPTWFEVRMFNGFPGIVGEWEAVPSRERDAPRFVLTCEIDDQGRIDSLHSILATSKLRSVRFH